MAHRQAQRFNAVTLEMLWTRLISIVDEAAAALVRTSFSTVVRESNDFACVLTDAQGLSLAQATDSIPSFIGTVPRTIVRFLEEYPPRDARARRHPHHQRHLARHRPSAGHHRREADLPSRAPRRIRGLGRACAGHRRPHPLARRARRLRGRPADPDHEGAATPGRWTRRSSACCARTRACPTR